MNGEAGKGDRYRPVDQKKWARNYEFIFNKQRKTRARKKKRTYRKQ